MLSGRAIHHSQLGYSLVEIAVVLAIIGLLLGGFLKGQEMIQSSRVRTLAENASSIRTAYLGFQDRYDRVPGDWSAVEATVGIGAVVNNPVAAISTTNNGRLDNPSGANAYAEPNAMWEQLGKAGFIKAGYPGTNAVPTQNNGLTPLNVYGAPIIVGRTNEYLDSASPPPVRLHVYIGRFVPVSAMRELDVKIDDGSPRSGALRATIVTATIFTGGPSGWGGMQAGCINIPGGLPPTWNVAADAQDCNAVLMF
jgi:prepilin-type N-terminal cleavage/methylation domain-containing protein